MRLVAGDRAVRVKIATPLYWRWIFFFSRSLVFKMPPTAAASISMVPPAARRSRTWHIAGYVYFTFICYVSIGLPLAVLPPFVHLRMGYSAVLAGLAISIQYIATLLSRPWAGHISDHMGAKVSVMWGMAGTTVSGALLVGAAA